MENSTNDWLQKIEEEFNSQTPEQIKELLTKCLFRFRDNNMIKNIIRTVNKNKTISFNQWKALRAQLSKTNNPTKSI